MKIIKYITIIAFVLFPFTFKAQNTKVNKADKSFEMYSYNESIKKFEAISNKTYEINKKLAESYFRVGNFAKSEEYYKELVKSEKRTSLDIFNYTQVLKINQNYVDAEIWMEEYYKLEKDDSRAKLYTENSGFYMDLLMNQGAFIVRNLSLNSEQQDFGTSFYKDKIVFASTNVYGKSVKRIWNWNELPFLDLFEADEKNSELVNIVPFNNKINKKYHEGPASFSKDGNFMAVTRNNYKGKSKDGVIKLQLFTSKYENNKWTKFEAFPYNSNEYSVGHASLTEDGKTMYFASDMPGGYGGVDIYVSHLSKDGKWSKPENLGNVINTEGNEMFPYIHESGFLFFASDGLLSLGGLDVFLTKKIDNKYTKPKNLGAPINSSYDDFSFIADSGLVKGFFSSNRPKGLGNDDIYSFRTVKPIMLDIDLRGIAYDTEKNILTGAEINLIDSTGKIVKTVKTDKTGKFEFTLLRNTNYKIEGKKEKYVSDIEEINGYTEKYTINKDLFLEPISGHNLICNVFDGKTKEPISSVKIIADDKIKNKQKELLNKNDGSALIKFIDYKLNDSLDYMISFEKEGYAKKTLEYKKIITEDDKNTVNVYINKIEIGEDLGKIIALNPIYFDFDKYNIRPDAAKELDKIVKIMNEYPNMVIELSSYTDCRGASIYNLKLSDRRAKSSAHYIKTRISNPTRIYGDGYGETRLINNCHCEGSNKSNCSEEEHQQNRRTEFKIIRK